MCIRDRVHPVSGQADGHSGLDIPAPEGTVVLAAAGGTVSGSGCDGETDGNYVEIGHADGVSTRYTHLSQRAVEEGDAVAQGTVVGYVGKTGNATGSHLHLAFLLDGTAVDPKPFYPGNDWQIK